MVRVPCHDLPEPSLAPTLNLTCPPLRAADPEAMDRIGQALAGVLAAGDVLAISGPLGAGKSQLCRAIVRTLLSDPFAEVPSPSYTLVNVYPSRPVPVWHADLYRIADPEELLELGLDDAMTDAIVLIEWPGRMSEPPARQALISIRPQPDDGRLLQLTTAGPGWEPLLAVWRRLA